MQAFFGVRNSNRLDIFKSPSLTRRGLELVGAFIFLLRSLVPFQPVCLSLGGTFDSCQPSARLLIQDGVCNMPSALAPNKYACACTDCRLYVSQSSSFRQKSRVTASFHFGAGFGIQRYVRYASWTSNGVKVQQAIVFRCKKKASFT